MNTDLFHAAAYHIRARPLFSCGNVASDSDTRTALSVEISI